MTVHLAIELNGFDQTYRMALFPMLNGVAPAGGAGHRCMRSSNSSVVSDASSGGDDILNQLCEHASDNLNQTSHRIKAT